MVIKVLTINSSGGSMVGTDWSCIQI